MHKTRTSYKDQMCKIFHDYQDQHGHAPTALDDLYEWAKRNGRYEKARFSEKTIFKREMRDALHSERITDEDGNEARRNTAIYDKDNQLYLWGVTLEMPVKHVRMSFQQRKLALGAGAIRLDKDVQFYNKHNRFGAQLEFDYDLNQIVSDSRHSDEYPEERPEEDD